MATSLEATVTYTGGIHTLWEEPVYGGIKQVRVVRIFGL